MAGDVKTRENKFLGETTHSRRAYVTQCLRELFFTSTAMFYKHLETFMFLHY